MQRTWLFGTALILSLGLAACGDDDSSADMDNRPDDDKDASTTKTDASKSDAARDAARASDSATPASDGDSGSDTDVADASTDGVDAATTTTDAGRDASTPADAGRDASSPVVDAGPAAEKFGAIYSAIIEPSCKGCHADNNSGLRFNTAAAAYDAIVNVKGKQSQCANLDLIEPNDPSKSSLYLKVAGTTCGPRMPAGRNPLSDAQIKRISDWISGGAAE